VAASVKPSTKPSRTSSLAPKSLISPIFTSFAPSIVATTLAKVCSKSSPCTLLSFNPAINLFNSSSPNSVASV
jgi:hypothetical protein